MAENGAGAPGVTVDVIGRTDVGLVREHNEDSFLVVRLDDQSRDPQALRKHGLGGKGTLLVVCDGMGGAAAGEVASNMAVESICATMVAEGNAPRAPDGMTDDAHTGLARKLRMAARDANGQIFREARENLSRSGMGTTMTAVLLADKHALIAQVGDSRAYVWRDGAFTQVTRDQSLVNQLLETGHITPEQAKFFEHSNVILQALGVQEEVEVQLSQVELRKGDRFLVCSDGLVGVVTDEEIAAVMGACDDPEECSRILVEMANGSGGPDNISVIVARVDGEGLPAPAAEDKVAYQLWRIDPQASAPTQPGDLSPAADAQKVPEQRDTGRIPRRSPAVELASMSVVFGLLLGSILIGALWYGVGVTCHLEARHGGLQVIADGRDTGVRTAPGGSGTVRLRLKPGRHTLSLRGQGAPDESREVDVAQGARCDVSFLEPASAALPPSESHSEPLR